MCISVFCLNVFYRIMMQIMNLYDEPIFKHNLLYNYISILFIFIKNVN
jgi:hypothetical protein